MDRVDRETSCHQSDNTREVISLGGWCGPAEALRMLKIRKKALPFDYIHSSMEGINLMFSGNESVYFPLPGDSRSRYAIYPHHDMQDEEIIKSMKKRFTLLWRCLTDEKPILFIRTVINPDYKTELQQAKTFTEILKNRFQRTKDRLILIFHDQESGTVQLAPLAENIMCWSAQGEVGWHVADHDEIFRSYMKVISAAMKENNWPPHQQIKGHKLIAHNSRGIHKLLFEDRPQEKPELGIHWNTEGDLSTILPASLGKTPIIIGGCLHSGATLLCSILSSHPAVYSVSDNLQPTDYINSSSSPFNVHNLYNEKLNELPETYTHWCEASSENILYIAEILKLLGKDARILNLIRDGRDVVAANEDSQSWRARVSPERWMDYISVANKYAKHPQVLTIKYEDLLSQYGITIKKVCAFLGLDPVTELMNYPESITPENGGEWYTNKRVCDECSSVGSWKNASNNSIIFKFLEWPGVVLALEASRYILPVKFTSLRRLKRKLWQYVRFFK